MVDDTAGSVTMTIAGMMVPLIIGPHVISNLLIRFDFIHILFSFPFFPIFPLSLLIQPSSSPFCSFPSPPSFLSHSIFSPRSPLPRCPLILVQVSRSRRTSLSSKPSLLSPPQSLLSPSNMLASLPYVQTQSSYFSNAAFLLLLSLLVLLSCPPLL